MDENLLKNFEEENTNNSSNYSNYQILPKTCEETIFFCFKNYDLTILEYSSYKKLLNENISHYNEDNKDHENLLKNLFDKSNELILNSNSNTNNTNNIDNQNKKVDLVSSNTLGYNSIITSSIENSKEIEEINNGKNKKINTEYSIWRIIGFQTDNPRTDFRAGGLCSLKFMIYFIDHYKNESIKIFKEELFPFALSCIRISYLTRALLYLFPKDELEPIKRNKRFLFTSRKEIKTFFRLFKGNNCILFDIMSVSLIFVYSKYVLQKNILDTVTGYFLIEPIISIAIKNIKSSLNKYNFNNNLSFMNVLDNINNHDLKAL